MTTTCRFLRASMLAAGAISAMIGLAGCRAIDYYDSSVEQPVPVDVEPPRELSMAMLPSYRLEPPDMLRIEMLKLIPLPPYRTEVYDVLQIDAVGTLFDQPINNYFMVEGDGSVNLGPAYGSVRVAGMTIPEAREAIQQKLLQVLTQPEVSVQLARAAGTQEITGEYLVGPDGTVNLRRYGSVHVAGLTIAEAQAAMQKHLSQYFDSPEVAIDVTSYASKVYYVVTEGAGMGDDIVRLPVTGNETVLDAISQIGGLTQASSKKIWIARPAAAGFGCEQILPVDYEAITRGCVTSTNYQILPDDRIFIAQDDTVALTNLIGTLTGPLERVAGTTSLSGSTVRNMQTLGRQFNRPTRNNN